MRVRILGQVIEEIRMATAPVGEMRSSSEHDAGRRKHGNGGRSEPHDSVDDRSAKIRWGLLSNGDR